MYTYKIVKNGRNSIVQRLYISVVFLFTFSFSLFFKFHPESLLLAGLTTFLIDTLLSNRKFIPLRDSIRFEIPKRRMLDWKSLRKFSPDICSLLIFILLVWAYTNDHFSIAPFVEQLKHYPLSINIGSWNKLYIVPLNLYLALATIFPLALSISSLTWTLLFKRENFSYKSYRFVRSRGPIIAALIDIFTFSLLIIWCFAFVNSSGAWSESTMFYYYMLSILTISLIGQIFKLFFSCILYVQLKTQYLRSY